MSLFIETIKIIEGTPMLVEYHQERFDRTRSEHFTLAEKISLKDSIVVPSILVSEKAVKCRIIYGETIEKVEFIKYRPAQMNSLKLIVDNDISYQYKYHNRAVFDNHMKNSGGSDNILIIKDGFVTDTSFSNVVFKNNDEEWVTPDSFLLNGVKRQYLLRNGMIGEETISIGDVHKYKAVKLINAMLDLQDTQEIPIKALG